MPKPKSFEPIPASITGICQKCRKNKFIKFKILRTHRHPKRHYNPEYRHKGLRRKVIKSLFLGLPRSISLKNETLYLGVAVFDHVTSIHLFPEKMLFAVGLICLGLAVKVRQSQYTESCMAAFRKKFFKKVHGAQDIEKKILKMLNYDLNILTPYDVIKNTVKKCRSYKSLTPKEKEKFNLLFASICFEVTKCYDMYKYKLSAISISILMVLRFKLNKSDLIPVCQREIFSFEEICLTDSFASVMRILKKLDF